MQWHKAFTVFYVGTWNTGCGWVFFILYVRTLTVHVWILLACVHGFYDGKGGHFNELKTQEQEWKDIFNGPLINNKEPIHLNVVSNKKYVYVAEHT